jgi:hypothetical protein
MLALMANLLVEIMRSPSNRAYPAQCYYVILSFRPMPAGMRITSDSAVAMPTPADAIHDAQRKLQWTWQQGDTIEFLNAQHQDVPTAVQAITQQQPQWQ